MPRTDLTTPKLKVKGKGNSDLRELNIVDIEGETRTDTGEQRRGKIKVDYNTNKVYLVKESIDGVQPAEYVELTPALAAKLTPVGDILNDRHLLRGINLQSNAQSTNGTLPQ